MEKAAGKRVFLIGGGIGIPPMLQLSKEIKKAGQAYCELSVLGYRNELFLNTDLEKYSQVYVATEDGSAGTKGTVLDAIKEKGLSGDVIFACGPMPMLRAIKEYAAENEYGSLYFPGRAYGMWCRCLPWLCRARQKNVDAPFACAQFTRICTDGPVFAMQRR